MDSGIVDKPVNNPAKRHRYGLYALVSGILEVVLNFILSQYSSIFVFFLTPAVFVVFLYFLTFWIVDLVRRRGGVERPESKTAKLVTNIVFAVMLVLTMILFYQVFWGIMAAMSDAGH